jgi:hypothetical protein
VGINRFKEQVEAMLGRKVGQARRGRPKKESIEDYQRTLTPCSRAQSLDVDPRRTEQEEGGVYLSKFGASGCQRSACRARSCAPFASAATCGSWPRFRKAAARSTLTAVARRFLKANN